MQSIKSRAAEGVSEAARNQGNYGYCYAFAMTTVIQAARRVQYPIMTEPSYETDCLQLINQFKENVTIKNYTECLKFMEQRYREKVKCPFSWKQISAAEALNRIRDLNTPLSSIAFLFLDGQQWINFKDFVREKKKDIMTHEILNKGVNVIGRKDGHAVSVCRSNDGTASITTKNSWGQDSGDQGYFRVDEKLLLDPAYFIDFIKVTFDEPIKVGV